jgi:Tfp pilus assembly protein PilN
VLHQLAAVLPDDTWFDSLAMNSPTAAAPAGTPPAAGAAVTSGVTLTGYTASPESLARVLQRLAVVPSLSDVKLTTTQRSTVGKKEMFQFTITANISTSGGAS